MTNYKDAPETTPYGTPILVNLRGGGVFEIIGTQGKGFMFERQAAEQLLSPAALSRAVEHDGYLCFAEKATGHIVIYELGGGRYFEEIKPKEVKAATYAVVEQYPDYFSERSIQPIPAKPARGPKAPRSKKHDTPER